MSLSTQQIVSVTAPSMPDQDASTLSSSFSAQERFECTSGVQQLEPPLRTSSAARSRTQLLLKALRLMPLARLAGASRSSRVPISAPLVTLTEPETTPISPQSTETSEDVPDHPSSTPPQPAACPTAILPPSDQAVRRLSPPDRLPHKPAPPARLGSNLPRSAGLTRLLSVAPPSALCSVLPAPLPTQQSCTQPPARDSTRSPSPPAVPSVSTRLRLTPASSVTPPAVPST